MSKEAMKLALEWDKRRKYIMPYVVRDAIREALAEQPAQQQEPVGTVQCINGVTIGYLDVMQPVGTKLYTSLQPAQPRKPLPFNKEDMEGLDVNQRLGFKLGWKSAEAAHNIKENT